MFGVLIFALNESKFIGYALRSYLSSPLVEAIIVVEGCVALNAHAANEYGLSKDNTVEVVGAVTDDRIVYERYGWAENKAELRTRCIQLCEEWCPNVAYYLQTDADEILGPGDLKALKKGIEREKYPDTILFKYWHFWKRPDLVAVGSLWDAWIPRCYRNYGEGMYFTSHAGGPRRPGGYHLKTKYHIPDVKVYHYGPMKEGQDVRDKLQFYQNRDGKGVDTWTDWRPGKNTHWTHGHGTAIQFTGQHPPAIAGDVWDLIPKG